MSNYIFIQYINNPPLLFTANSNLDLSQWIVSDLLFAFQQLPNSPIAALFIANVALYPSMMNANAFALDLSVSAITTGKTHETALVIKPIFDNSFQGRFAIL